VTFCRSLIKIAIIVKIWGLPSKINFWSYKTEWVFKCKKNHFFKAYQSQVTTCQSGVKNWGLLTRGLLYPPILKRIYFIFGNRFWFSFFCKSFLKDKIKNKVILWGLLERVSDILRLTSSYLMVNFRRITNSLSSKYIMIL
jgi:hypothetical protein